MRKSLKTWMRVLLAGALALTISPRAGARKHTTDLAQILAQMNEASKKLENLTANLQYTKYTKLVDDNSTESGQMYFCKGKPPEIRIDIQKPAPKTILFKKIKGENKGEIYLPNMNQIWEYNLQQNSGLVQQFLLLGFGTDAGELKKAYDIKYLGEEDINGDTNVQLELVPRKSNLSAQISKIQIWVSEESWLPTQQIFFENGGDYLKAIYTGVKKNRGVSGSKFELNAPSNAKRVKMN